MPNLQDPAKLTDLTPIPRIHRCMLNELRLTCQYAEHGCPEIVMLEHLKAHERACKFKPQWPSDMQMPTTLDDDETQGVASEARSGFFTDEEPNDSNLSDADDHDDHDQTNQELEDGRRVSVEPQDRSNRRLMRLANRSDARQEMTWRSGGDAASPRSDISEEDGQTDRAGVPGKLDVDTSFMNPPSANQAAMAIPCQVDIPSFASGAAEPQHKESIRQVEELERVSTATIEQNARGAGTDSHPSLAAVTGLGRVASALSMSSEHSLETDRSHN